MEDGTVGNETKAKAEAFFNTGMETTTQDERVGGVGGAFSSTSSAGTVAVNGPFTALSINQGNESTQTSGEIGRGPNAESAVGKASKDIEAWMFGDGSE